MSAPAKDRKPKRAEEVDEICFLCGEPYNDEHRTTCPEWPKEARNG